VCCQTGDVLGLLKGMTLGLTPIEKVANRLVQAETDD